MRICDTEMGVLLCSANQIVIFPKISFFRAYLAEMKHLCGYTNTSLLLCEHYESRYCGLLKNFYGLIRVFLYLYRILS